MTCSSLEVVVRRVQHFSKGERRIIFQRVNSVKECTLCDVEKKDVIWTLEEVKLQAVTLKGGHSDRKGTCLIQFTPIER